MHRIPIGVLGASGYVGRELCQLLGTHPAFEVTFATANERRGERLRIGEKEVTLVAVEDAPLQRAELVFSALPHGASGEWAQRAAANGARAIDLSADLRPGNTELRVPYGLTELRRADVAGAPLVANPGCYPTAILIALAPLLERNLVAPGGLITIDAASGVTGAGNAPRAEYLFAEVTENFRAYGIGNTHRHLPEMRAAVKRAGCDADILFTPHLLPVARGILATITVPLARLPDDLLGVWRDFYAGEPFVEVVEESPTLRDVVHRNVVRLTARAAAHVRQPTVVIFSAIDNLMKGAAGQAVQNANLICGLAEPTGLPA